MQCLMDCDKFVTPSERGMMVYECIDGASDKCRGALSRLKA